VGPACSESPHCAVFSPSWGFLILPSKHSLTPCYGTPSACILPLKWSIQFHDHIGNRQNYSFVYCTFYFSSLVANGKKNYPRSTSSKHSQNFVILYDIRIYKRRGTYSVLSLPWTAPSFLPMTAFQPFQCYETFDDELKVKFISSPPSVCLSVCLCSRTIVYDHIIRSFRSDKWSTASVLQTRNSAITWFLFLVSLK
jgi:hypothetical protein